MAASKPPPAPITRAASIGMSIGVGVAGLALMGVAVFAFASQAECTGADSNTCFLEQALALDFARWQLWMGAALEAVALGALLWLRASDRKAARKPDEPLRLQ